MSIAQLATRVPAYVPELAAIRADMETTRVAYHHLLDSLSAADLEQPCVVSKWTVKEVMCHIVVNMEQAIPMMVKQARKGKPMPGWLNSRFGHWMNYQLAARSARKATHTTLAQRYDAAQTRLLALLDGVGDDEWTRPTGYPDGRPLTMETVFHVPADHFALHAAWIRQTLAPAR